MRTISFRQKLGSFSLNREDGFTGKHPLGFHNLAQLLGAFNDNLFKFLVTFFLIDLLGKESAGDIMFFVSVSYVLPFLLFASSGGIMADRFSKQRLVVFLKGFELIIVLASFFAFGMKSPIGCYSLVFMIALQSALMGPSKYSIIPELVRKDQIPKANGLITASTYLAIIFGTFLASFLTQVTERNFLVANSACLIAAIIGFIASLYIPYTTPRRSKQRTSPFFVVQTVRTLKYCKRTPRLVLAVLGSAFFLFIGAFIQINIVPYAMNVLALSDVGGGYLFLCASVGIAAGASLGGRACKKEIDLGLSCFALISLALAFIALPIVAKTVPLAIGCLVLMGFFGGLFVVPLETYMQAFSPSEIRGQVVATASFLSFFGVLLAPLCLLLFGKVFGATPGVGFSLIGFIVLGVFCLMIRYLSIAFFHFLSQKLFQPFYDLHFIGYPFGPHHQEDKMAIVCKNKSLRHLAVLLGESAKIHLFYIKEKKGFFDKILSSFANIDIYVLSEKGEIDRLRLKEEIEHLMIGVKPLFLFSDPEVYKTFMDNPLHAEVLRSSGYGVKAFHLRHISHFSPTWKRPLKRVQMIYQFTEVPRPLEKESEALLSHDLYKNQ